MANGTWQIGFIRIKAIDNLNKTVIIHGMDLIH
jgi:hypothetical protein